MMTVALYLFLFIKNEVSKIFNDMSSDLGWRGEFCFFLVKR